LHIQNDDHKLAGAVLRLITLQRNGEVIDQGLVKKVVDSFVSLGLDNTDLNKECLDIYKEHLEAPFIAATDQYYKKESEAFLAQNSVSDYLKKAEERLREEEDRVERYLNTKTRKELISKCEHVLIREHAERMWDSFQTLLDFDQDEDLQRMYALLSRIPEGLEPLRKRFEGHVKQAGLTAISKLIGEGGANVDALDPKAYVDALLEVHRKNSETVTRSFKGEAGFAASLDKACREFVNRNAATGTSSTKSPELIAKHADMLLRRNNKMAEEDDLEGALNRVVRARDTIEILVISYPILHRWSSSSTWKTRTCSKPSTPQNFPNGLSTGSPPQTRANPA
jgi:cullin 1